MESINANHASMVQKNQGLSGLKFHPNVSSNKNNVFKNDNACSIMPRSISTSSFDLAMSNFALFKDSISAAQDGISAMQHEGEGIRELVQKAKEEGVTPEILDKIEKEVSSKLAQIQQIKDNTSFNGVNLFNSSFSLDIPNWQDYIGASNTEEATNELAETIASFDIDINIDGGGFSIGASAKIDIGYNDDGSLQINVDASMDYDLSGLLEHGVDSDEAFDMINNFLNMLGVQQGDLGNISNILDELFSQSMNYLDKYQNSSENGDVEVMDSRSLKGKIVQQASITLDEFANQIPGIAINIL